LGNAQRAGDFERSTGIRQIPNHTINRATAEFYRAGFQYAVPRGSAVALQIRKRCYLLFCGGFRLAFRVPQGGCDDLFREACPNLGPCEPKTKLAIFEIDRGTAITDSRRLSIDIATPPPMRAVGLFHHSPDGEPAPNHLVIVELDLAVGDGGAQHNAFQIGCHLDVSDAAFA
jgi:hypothetical protein